MVELFGRIHVHMEQQVHLSWLHVCPKKLWPFSNKYHTICCCVSGILWGIELVEGTDRPCELPRPKFEDIGGSTVGLLLCMLQPIYHRVFLAVLDSGFCVLKAIIDLMSLMSTYGTNERYGKVTKRDWVEDRQRKTSIFN
jgi:hypothetical protein